MKNEFNLAFNEVLEEKQLPKEIILKALESAMVSAYRRAVNASNAQHVEAKVDIETGKVTIYAEKEVVETVEDARTEVSLKDAQKVDKDHFKTIYFDFSKEDAYIQFVSKETDKEENLEMLLELFRFCRRSEFFNEIIEDQYANWEDDKSLIIGTIKKILKELPNDDENFFMVYYPDADTCKDYGEFLLLKTFEDDTALLNMIQPVLQNWDAERVAILDMIMIKMALCEFIYCPTIPTKVTLNEYVELAKNYSTSKSKEFVNGILDKLLNELTAKGLINKEGRGLLDE